MANKDLDVYSIGENKIVCPICGSDKFWHRTTLMNTAGATFFGFDWANKEADNLVCGSCGYVLWFLFEPDQGFND
jgi:ribosomal protein S27AE